MARAERRNKLICVLKLPSWLFDEYPRVQTLHQEEQKEHQTKRPRLMSKLKLPPLSLGQLPRWQTPHQQEQPEPRGKRPQLRLPKPDTSLQSEDQEDQEEQEKEEDEEDEEEHEEPQTKKPRLCSPKLDLSLQTSHQKDQQGIGSFKKTDRSALSRYASGELVPVWQLKRNSDRWQPEVKLGAKLDSRSLSQSSQDKFNPVAATEKELEDSLARDLAIGLDILPSTETDAEFNGPVEIGDSRYADTPSGSRARLGKEWINENY